MERRSVIRGWSLRRVLHVFLILIFALGLVPLLAHRSGAPLVFGRYSIAYAILLFGWISIAALAILLWFRGFRSWVVGHPGPFLSLGGLLVGLVLAELGLRVVLGLTSNPNFFIWGTSKAQRMLNVGNVNVHDIQEEGYFTYPLNTILHQGTYSHNIRTIINNLGFRGEDVDVDNPENVVRILALGGSSVFGYGSPEGGTYPEILENQLNSANGELRFDVVNLGMPHATSDNVVAIAVHEGLKLNPDIVILYAGANDTSVDAYAAFDNISIQACHSWNALTIYSVLFQQLHTKFNPCEVSLFPQHFLEREADKASRQFISNVNRLLELSTRNKFMLVLVTQQLTSFIEESERPYRSSTTYDEEVHQVLDELQTRKGLTRRRAQLFIHQRIMSELRAYSESRAVTLVDGIEALDDDREQLTSWVHLSPKGNEILADALSKAIVEEMVATSQ